MCVQEEKDKLKRPNRVPAKARDVLHSHCERYNQKNNTTLTPMQFAQKFGWKLSQISHDIEHAFNNWCSYCENPYSGMSHGLADVTLDIINPDEPPYYTNVRYCCGTCNRRKGQMGLQPLANFLPQ
jgi:hypothetical protein